MDDFIAYLILLITTIFGFMLIYFKSYSQEKGKNVATKEDIADITNKIETVKLQLSHSHSQKSELLEKHKLALISFLEEYVVWHSRSIRDISVVDNITAVQQIREKIEELSNQRNIVERGYWKLLIFEIEDSKFTELILNIFNKTDKLCLLTLNFLISMEQNSVYISRSGLTEKLTHQRIELRDKFLCDREPLEEKILTCPGVLMKAVRKKYLKLFEF